MASARSRAGGARFGKVFDAVILRNGENVCAFLIVPKDSMCEKIGFLRGVLENYSYALACSFLLLYLRGIGGRTDSL